MEKTCPLCKGKGETTQVDEIHIGPGYFDVKNPRPAVCMVCNGIGVVKDQEESKNAD